MNTRVTSNRITELQPNEIFVFGSNLEGAHGGGAAYLAWENRFIYSDICRTFAACKKNSYYD